MCKFDLELNVNLDFGEKSNFSKFRIEPAMLKFLATTENTRKIEEKIRVRIAGKSLKNLIVKFLFTVLLELYDPIKAILFLIGRRNCWKR